MIIMLPRFQRCGLQVSQVRDHAAAAADEGGGSLGTLHTLHEEREQFTWRRHGSRLHLERENLDRTKRVWSRAVQFRAPDNSQGQN